MVFGKFETNSKILHSLKFVSSPQLANKIFSLPWRDRRTAFTLAEVLITLVVIGVVAAIALLLIINQTQKFVLKQQFKKSINTLNQAIQKTYTDLGYIPDCYYIDGRDRIRNDCLVFHNELIQNLKTLKYCEYSFTDGCLKNIKSAGGIFTDDVLNNSISYVLEDGSVLWIWRDGSVGSIYLLDVNGIKEPNKWGYDVFTFILTDKKLKCYAEFIEDGGTKCSDILLNK